MATVIDKKLYAVPRAVERVQGTALVVGVVALLLALALSFVSPGGFPRAFWRPYLVAFTFWTGVTVGSLPLIMLHHLTGGGWGVVLRRIFEAATRTLPLLAILFLPLAFAVVTRTLYPWTFPQLAHEHAIEHKAIFLNIPFFLGRTVFYFAVWFTLAYFLNKWSLEQDTAEDPRVQRSLRERMQSLSGPGILLFGLTVTFAAVDWLMSLEPEWFSTIFGLLIMAGFGLSAFAFAIAVAVWLSRQDAALETVYQPRWFHDQGKLLLAFIMLWAYFMFSQYLIIWAGNLPEEIPWYLRRLRGGWQYIALVLVLLHFALPFVLLLSRDLKRTAKLLGAVAILVLAMRVVDLFWTVAPSVLAADANGAPHGAGAILSYAMSFITPIGVGGVWLWYFARELRTRPLLPLGDEGLDDALEVKHGHH
jgi:type IV secretory pathway TrbD component